MQDTPEAILKKYWGYDQFRPPQKEIIKAVLAGKDCLALLPTGGGKSICFQVPALIQEGVCLVISPLIALMEDQVNQLKKRGINCAVVHSGMSHHEIDIALDNCVYGKVKLLYLSPERVQTEIFQERLKKMNVSMTAIDEAHCISEWGYDFRPPYLQLSLIREFKKGIPFLALTASATNLVKADIIQKLGLNKPVIHQRSFARQNISFAVRETENKESKLLDVLRKIQGSSIIYLRSRKATLDISNWLVKQGISATYYHAGLTHEARKERQEEWIQNQKRVMVATNAFGMGIDKPDVRTVIHLGLPESLEAYYQEAGRAGRDGKKSYAVLIYHKSDVQSLEAKVNQSQPTIDYIRRIYQALANYYQLAEGSAQNQSFEFDLEDFSIRFNMRASHVYPALKKLEEEAFIELYERFYKPSKVHIAVDKTRLYQFQVAHEKFDPLIHTLLRIYGAEMFTNFTAISETTLAHGLGLKVNEVKATLDQLNKLQIISYDPTSDKPRLTFLTPRYDAARLPLNKQKLDERKRYVLNKMEAMANYATQPVRCRQQVMLDYFNEEGFESCHICDICLEKKKKENRKAWKDYGRQILVVIDNKKMSIEDLETAVAPEDHHLFIEVIRELMDDGILEFDELWMVRRRSTK